MHLSYAIPDHPWVDSADGAAVRISLTVAAPGKGEGVLEKVLTEQAREDGENEVTLIRSRGLIAPNLQLGVDLHSALELQASSQIGWEGMKPHGKGFLVTQSEAAAFGYWTDAGPVPPLTRYLNGKDITDKPRQLFAIDLFGYTESEATAQFPALMNHLLIDVKPERDLNNREVYRKNWWFFGEPRKRNRPSLLGLSRFIVTVKTAKHRIFSFVDSQSVADSKLIIVASESEEILGILSSVVHCIWTLRVGGHLGVGNDPTYVVGSSFNKFPFPALPESPLKQHIRELGERLDMHRKTQQAQHPELTLTGMYNVLEAVRAGTPLSAKEKAIHDKGLVSILKQIHDDLDAAVLEAYGWSDLRSRDIPVANKEAPHSCGAGGCAAIAQREALPNDLPSAPPQECGGSSKDAFEQELLTRLVALNHERAAEEKRGHIRYLRPDYQNPTAANPPAEEQPSLAGTEASSPKSPISNPQSPLQWPTGLAAQVSVIQKLIPHLGPDPEALSAQFGKKNAKRTQQIVEILETLAGLGKL